MIKSTWREAGGNLVSTLNRLNKITDMSQTCLHDKINGFATTNACLGIKNFLNENIAPMLLFALQEKCLEQL